MHCRSLDLSRLSYQSLYPSTLPLVPSFLSLSFFFLFSRFFSFWATFQYNNHKLRFITSKYQTQFKHWTICGLKAYINGGLKKLHSEFWRLNMLLSQEIAKTKCHSFFLFFSFFSSERQISINHNVIWLKINKEISQMFLKHSFFKLLSLNDMYIVHYGCIM